MDASEYISSDYFIHYSDTRAFMPFVVAPMPSIQNTVILGPSQVADSGHDFIDRLYRPTSGGKLSGAAVRVFRFQKSLVVGLVLPTLLADEHGRPGLGVTLGFFTDISQPYDHASILALYMGRLIEAFGRTFGAASELETADKLLRSLRDPSEAASGFSRVRAALDSLLLASDTISAVLESHRHKNFLPRSWRMLSAVSSLWKRSGVASVIACDQSARTRDMLKVLIRELLRGMNRGGATGLLEQGSCVNCEGRTIRLLQVPHIAEAKHARLKIVDGTRCILIYSRNKPWSLLAAVRRRMWENVCGKTGRRTEERGK